MTENPAKQEETTQNNEIISNNNIDEDVINEEDTEDFVPKKGDMVITPLHIASSNDQVLKVVLLLSHLGCGWRLLNELIKLGDLDSKSRQVFIEYKKR